MTMSYQAAFWLMFGMAVLGWTMFLIHAYYLRKSWQREEQLHHIVDESLRSIASYKDIAKGWENRAKNPKAIGSNVEIIKGYER